MDLPWGDEISNKFITNVGLITSDGPFGADVMACEWTHHISYSPGLIAVCICVRSNNYELACGTGYNIISKCKCSIAF